jgi:hypothetical protein
MYKRHGLGLLQLANGFKYEGQFKDNFMDGPKGVACYEVCARSKSYAPHLFVFSVSVTQMFILMSFITFLAC